MWCEIVTDFSRLEELSPIWRDWVSRDPKADVFQTWEWVQSYWKAYGRNLSLWSPVLYQEQKPVAVLPLARRGQRLEFLSSPWSDYNDILCKADESPAALEAVLQTMLDQSGAWKECLLDCLPSDSKIVRNLRVLSSQTRKHLQLIERSPAPTILLSNDRAEVLQKLANKDQLKRYFNKLSRLGRITFRHIESREEAREHLETFFHQHITRWAMAGVRSEFLELDQRHFYYAMVETLDPRNELRFGVVELDGRPVAYHFGFQRYGKLTWYKPAFDVNYWDYAPGDVLLRSLFQYGAEAELTEFDFSLGDEAYKYRYSNHVKQTYMLYFDRRPTQVVSQLKQIERQAREALRKRPQLKRRVAWGLDAVTRVCSRKWVANYVKNACASFRRLIWYETEVFVYRSEGSGSSRCWSARVISETLDSLAELSIDYPDFLDRSRLIEARTRLKAGDRLFIVKRLTEQPPIIVWVGKRAELAVRHTGEAAKLSVGGQELAIYDVWARQAKPDAAVPAEVLRAVLDRVSGQELWIACSGGSHGARRHLESAGFRLKKRVYQESLFYWLRRTHVSNFTEVTEGPLEIFNESI